MTLAHAGILSDHELIIHDHTKTIHDHDIIIANHVKMTNNGLEEGKDTALVYFRIRLKLFERIMNAASV